MSVVVPAYNAQSTIVETLHSVLAQTHRRLEVIIINDGSTDRTSALVRQLMVEDSRIRLVEQPNRGLSAARNAGVDQANGEFVAPLDADDLWHPRFIEACLRAMVAGGERTGFVYTLHHVIDEAGRIIASLPLHGFCGDVIDEHLALNFVGTGSAVLWRKQAMVQAGGFDTRIREGGGEDYLLQLRVAHAWSVQVVPLYLVGYRRTGMSMSSDPAASLRAHKLLVEIFNAEVAPIPRRIYRRSLGGAYRAALAKHLCRSQASQALSCFFSALRLDPRGLALDVALRTKNLVLRLQARGKPRPSWAEHLASFSMGADAVLVYRGGTERLTSSSF